MTVVVTNIEIDENKDGHWKIVMMLINDPYRQTMAEPKQTQRHCFCSLGRGWLLQIVHRCRRALWGQMLRPPHSLHVCLWRLCSQNRRMPKLSPCVGVLSSACQMHRFLIFLVQGKWPKCGTKTRHSSVLGCWKNQLLLSLWGHCGHFSSTARSCLETVGKPLLWPWKSTNGNSAWWGAIWKSKKPIAFFMYTCMEVTNHVQQLHAQQRKCKNYRWQPRVTRLFGRYTPSAAVAQSVFSKGFFWPFGSSSLVFLVAHLRMITFCWIIPDETGPWKTKHPGWTNHLTSLEQVPSYH